ncbi:MAG: 3-dehydroquinate synthase [Vicinamibacterales bacterium]
MAATRIDVAAAAGSYPVVVGAGALDSLGRLLDEAGLGPARIVVSSPMVWDLHGKRLASAFSGRRKAPVLVSDGERFKTPQTVARVYEALFAAGADRSAVIIAVGGGVIGDMVGFAAATFLRGVRLVHVPTTLLAQVDSAIGGKVGVNHQLGKNLIGAFHPPRLVVADPLVLATLPRREFRAGVYEIIKYGVIADQGLFERVRTRHASLFAHDPEELEAVVAACCRIKAEVVSGDERESGRRRILNFGHTVGHALEAVTEYRRLRHGEAVAYGMEAAAAIGRARGVTPQETVDRIAEVVAEMGPLPPVTDLRAADVIGATARDKKVVDGTLHFVAASGIGTTTELTDVTRKEIRQALKSIGIRK